MSPSATKSMICRTSKTATMMKDTPLLAEKSTQPLTMQYSKLFRETNWLSWNTNCWREPTQGPVFLLWMPQKCKSAKVNAKNANLPNVGEEFVKCLSIPAVRPAVLRGRVVVDYGSRSVRALAQPPHMHPLSYPPVSNPFLTQPFPAHSGYL